VGWGEGIMGRGRKDKPQSISATLNYMCPTHTHNTVPSHTLTHTPHTYTHTHHAHTYTYTCTHTHISPYVYTEKKCSDSKPQCYVLPRGGEVLHRLTTHFIHCTEHLCLAPKHIDHLGKRGRGGGRREEGGGREGGGREGGREGGEKG